MKQTYATFTSIHQGNGRVLLIMLTEKSPQRRKDWINRSLGRTAQG